MITEADRYARLMAHLDAFVRDRHWDQFHSPKNLVMALTGEVGELTEHFQWLTEDQSRALAGNTPQEIKDEMADVQIYLMMLARQLGVDLLQAAAEKMEKNALKYPVEASRGSSRKYTER